MQSPASSIQSPRPPGRSSGPPQVPFDKELMASLHVLLNQLGEVERQGLVMFHKIEESFKHPYTQQEAIADTANLLIQLDALSSQAKTTGFGALTILPTSPTVASTPSASASAAAGTPKPMFMSPRMQNHIHNNFNILQNNNNNNSNNNHTTTTPAATTGHNSSMDTQMQSPTSLSLVSTPAAAGTTATLPMATTPGAPTPVTNPGSATATPAATTATATISSSSGTAIGNGGVQGAASPFSSADVLMTSTTTSTPSASGPGSLSVMDPALGTLATHNHNNHPMASTTVATPATPFAHSSSGGVEPSVALAQMMDARNRDVQALYTEKRKLKSSLQIAAKMSRT
ncbi:hypothetical protein BGZ70_009751 [Mortierella alpina]|uniref:Uncharacterized protein n=1 Tax=Mortierella alpina TaxID=64518 RepID=A0A9P6J177_MORAP|nr:hypothetical protein BGZ70_009751 [Mortierella alpina]